MQTMSDEEVALSVRQVRADLSFAASSNRAVANLLTVYEQMGSFDLLASIPQRLGAVNADAVRAFARERLAPDRRSVGVLIPETAASGSGLPVQAADGRTDTDLTAAATEPALVQRRTTRPIPAAHLRIPELPQPVVRRLDTGLIILATRVPGESTHMRVRIAAGSRFDSPGREGTALLAARMVADGPASHLRKLDDREVRLSLSASDVDDPFTMFNVVEIAATFLPDDLAAVGDVVVSAVAVPVFRSEDLDRVRKSLAGELLSHQDDSRWRANRAVFEHLHEGSDPYGRPVEGSDESRTRITIADLSAFHKTYYRPDRTVVAIAGPRDPAATVELIAAALGGWQTASGAPGSAVNDEPRVRVTESREAAPPGASKARIVHVPLEKDQASIAVGLPGVSRNDENFAALAVLNYLLGETGYAGRLGERLVDTGLAYAVYSAVLADRASGPILITTDSARARDAVSRIEATLDEFAKHGISDAQLREAKGFVLGRLLFRFESAPSATAALADLGYFGERASAQAFARRVLDLTAPEVRAVARRYYDPSRAVIAVAGRW
jgi:zinc protease